MASADKSIEALGRTTGDQKHPLWRPGDVMAFGSKLANSQKLFSLVVDDALTDASGL